MFKERALLVAGSVNLASRVYHADMRHFGFPVLPTYPAFSCHSKQFAHSRVLSGRPKKVHPDTVPGFIKAAQQILGAHLRVTIDKLSGHRARNKSEAGRLSLEVNETLNQRPLKPESPIPSISKIWQICGVLYLINQPRNTG